MNLRIYDPGIEIAGQENQSRKTVEARRSDAWMSPCYMVQTIIQDAR